MFLLCYFERQGVSLFPTSFHSSHLSSIPGNLNSHPIYATDCPHVLTLVILLPQASSVQWGWRSLPYLPCRDTERTDGDDGVHGTPQQALQIRGLPPVFIASSQQLLFRMPSQASLFLPIMGN